ncbi:unnamed protein product [Calicophoron daubneyi]|uniref:Uncharacterized protein n=1 Tax=Calicophoron daubneyi TaxID=300641 RepID=A0AAV2TNE6_CALDB
MSNSGIGEQQPLDNKVAKEIIWKSRIATEEKTSRLYDSRFGVLKGPITKFAEDEMEDLVDKNRPRIADLLGERSDAPEPMSKYIKVLPSPKPVPPTSAGIIGWRCTDPAYWLERYGRYTRNLPLIYKQLKWPEGDSL